MNKELKNRVNLDDMYKRMFKKHFNLNVNKIL